jgi:hypothetical protein
MNYPRDKYGILPRVALIEVVMFLPEIILNKLSSGGFAHRSTAAQKESMLNLTSSPYCPCCRFAFNRFDRICRSTAGLH